VSEGGPHSRTATQGTSSETSKGLSNEYEIDASQDVLGDLLIA
jgi:hypothetical protein